MKFRSYERPDGRSRGQPEVLVCRKTIDELGMPSVDYDMLEELSAKIVADSTISHPRINIHTIDNNTYGYYYTHTNTIHADATSSERHFPASGGVVSTVAHELQHYADYKAKPLRTVAEGGFEAVFHSGKLLANKLASLAISEMPEVPTLYSTCSVENRAREQQKYENVRPYEQAILFPESIRTSWLMYDGQLSTETLARLGLSHYKRYASDYQGFLASWFNKVKR